MPLYYTLHALVRIRAPHITEASAGEIANAFIVLASYEIAVKQPLPWSAGNVPIDPDAGYIAFSDLAALRGPAAVTVHRSLLQQLADCLAAAADATAAAYPTDAAPDGSTPAEPGAPALGVAAQTEAAAADSPAVGPARIAPWLHLKRAGLVVAADSGCSAIDGLASVATPCRVVSRMCLNSKDLQPLLAPGFETGRTWALALAKALTACRFGPEGLGPDEPGVPAEAAITAFKAGDKLCAAASKLLQHYCAAGLEALQQEAGVQLLEALTSFLSAYREVTMCSAIGVMCLAVRYLRFAKTSRRNTPYA